MALKRYYPKISKVVSYSVRKHGRNCEVTPHFTLGEYQCHNGADTVKIDWKTANMLELARVFFEAPIKVSSAYRTPTYNSNVGGAYNSYHTKGRACDVYSSKISYTLLAKFFQAKGMKGVGCYYDDHFCHVDSRTSTFLWKNQSSTRVSTHLIVLKAGSSGQQVRDLQWLLKNIHKYDIDIDGKFGTKTKAIIKKFQRSHGLVIDGIIGVKTWKKLFIKPVKKKRLLQSLQQ